MAQCVALEQQCQVSMV